MPFSDAVANLVPDKFNEIQLKAVSCAITSNGGLSLFAKSTSWTYPVFLDGKANNELLLFGHKTHKPKIQLLIIIHSFLTI